MSYRAGNTWVIKAGSSLLTNHGAGIDRGLVESWVDEIVSLRRQGIRIVIVSSGAVAEGMKRLGIRERPNSIHILQAVAAVGQMGLVELYESAFQRHGVHTAQVLLTHDDLRSRQRYLNARNTLKELLDFNVVPVINENDTVVTDEIKFGDNDTLAALVANLIEANTLLLLTDQPGLMTANPRENPDAELVARMSATDPTLEGMAGGSSSMGRGGMITKIGAARIAARSGASTVIAHGAKPRLISSLAEGRIDGTLLTAESGPLVARKQWLATLVRKGSLVLDEGACRVVRQEGRSLLAVGVIGVSGHFTRGDMVACVDGNGTEIARGLVNYGSGEVEKLLRVSSNRIESVLGYVAEEELIHRDNMVFT